MVDFVYTEDGDALTASNIRSNWSFSASNLLGAVIDNDKDTNQTNIDYDKFASDTADYLKWMVYDAGNDYYKCVDASTIAWVQIEASSLTEAQFETNNCEIFQFESGKWILYNASEASADVARAQIMKTLFDDGGSSHIVSHATGVTAIKTPDSRDQGKRAYYATCSASKSCSPHGNVNVSAYLDLTFSDTSTNSDCSSWSDCYSNVNAGSASSTWEMPSGTNLNSCSGNGCDNDEIGTDTSGDELSNPATAQLSAVARANCGGVACNAKGNVQTILVASGTVSGTETLNWNAGCTGGSVSTSFYDFYTDGSIPAMSSISSDDYLTCVLETDAASISSSYDCAILKVVKSITAGNSLAVQVSFDNGSNWTSVSEEALAEIASAGSNLKVRFTITRTDVSHADYISAYAVYYG